MPSTTGTWRASTITRGRPRSPMPPTRSRLRCRTQSNGGRAPASTPSSCCPRRRIPGRPARFRKKAGAHPQRASSMTDIGLALPLHSAGGPQEDPMSAQEALAELEAELAGFPARTPAEDLYRHMLGLATALMGAQREDLVEAVRKWLALRSEPRTMIAV